MEWGECKVKKKMRERHVFAYCLANTMSYKGTVYGQGSCGVSHPTAIQFVAPRVSPPFCFRNYSGSPFQNIH
jgi:hypothetical protein